MTRLERVKYRYVQGYIGDEEMERQIEQALLRDDEIPELEGQSIFL